MTGNVLLGALAAGVVVIVIGLLAFSWWHRGDGRRSGIQPFPERPEGPVFGGEPMPVIEVASSEEDYRFLLAGRVFWQPLHSGGLVDHADPRALALETIVHRASAITMTVPPTDPGLAGYRVAASLGVKQPDAKRQLLAWATEVAIRISDEDAERLRKLAELRKTVQVWEHERGHERNVREYLGNDVFTSTGNAVVWWLARHAYNVEGAVTLLGALDQLSAAAQDRLDLVSQPLLTVVNGGGAPEYGLADSDGRHADDPLRALDTQLFPDRDDPRRRFFAHDLVKLADDHELPGFTAYIREVFDLADLAPPPDPEDGRTGDELSP